MAPICTAVLCGGMAGSSADWSQRAAIVSVICPPPWRKTGRRPISRSSTNSAWGSQGLNLGELAVLASTLDHVVHESSLDWLEAAYRVLQVTTTGRVVAEIFGQALSLYMMMLVTVLILVLILLISSHIHISSSIHIRIIGIGIRIDDSISDSACINTIISIRVSIYWVRPCR